MQSSPTIHQVGIIMNGVTGRMGTNQHLIRSICAIRKQGGIKVGDGEFIMPDPILVGRNQPKLDALAKANGIERVTTDLDAALADPFKHRVFRRAGPPAAAPTRSRRPSLLASTSTARNPRPFPRKAPTRFTKSPRKPASKTASCKTSSGCPD